MSSSHSATYFHYEPLSNFGIAQIRSGKNASNALTQLKAVLQCQFGKLRKHISISLHCTVDYIRRTIVIDFVHVICNKVHAMNFFFSDNCFSFMHAYSFGFSFQYKVSREDCRLMFIIHLFLLADLTRFGSLHMDLHLHNSRVWKHCSKGRNSLCFNADLLSKSCAIYPFQTIKTVRLRANLTEQLLADERYTLYKFYIT